MEVRVMVPRDLAHVRELVRSAREGDEATVQPLRLRLALAPAQFDLSIFTIDALLQQIGNLPVDVQLSSRTRGEGKEEGEDSVEEKEGGGGGNRGGASSPSLSKEGRGPRGGGETGRVRVSVLLAQFLHWLKGESKPALGALSSFSLKDFWGYLSYQHLQELLEKLPPSQRDYTSSAINKSLPFPNLGLERRGEEATLWVGGEGSFTPLHLDSYGHNLVFQVEGRKRWTLFPPSATSSLLPSRLPFEESTVWSRLISTPADFASLLSSSSSSSPSSSSLSSPLLLPFLQTTLEPGDILLVPKHWWHLVETLSPSSVAVNLWQPLPSDEEDRLQEVLGRSLVAAFAPHSEDWQLWNSKEDQPSFGESLLDLNEILRGTGEEEEKKDESMDLEKEEEEEEVEDQEEEKELQSLGKLILDELLSPDVLQLVASRIKERMRSDYAPPSKDSSTLH